MYTLVPDGPQSWTTGIFVCSPVFLSLLPGALVPRLLSRCGDVRFVGTLEPVGTSVLSVPPEGPRDSPEPGGVWVESETEVLTLSYVQTTKVDGPDT